MIEKFKWPTISLAVKLLIQVSQVFFLAKFLTQENFNLSLVAISIFNILVVFSEASVYNVFIQNKKSNNDISGSLLYFGVVSSFVLYLLLVVVAFFVTQKMHKQKLFYVLLLGSALILFSPYWQICRAYFERELNFKIPALVEICSNVIAVSLSIIFAISVDEVFFAPALFLFYSVSMFFIYKYALGVNIKINKSIDETRQTINNSIYNILFGIVNSINTQMDVFIAGFNIGGSDFSIFGISKDISLKTSFVVNPIISRVSLPLFVDSVKNGFVDSGSYLKVIKITNSVNFLFYGPLIFYPSFIIGPLLGDKYNGYEEIFSLMAMWGFVRSIGAPAGNLLFASGNFRLAFIFSVGTISVFAPAYYFGSKFGIKYMIFSMLSVMLAQQIFALWFFVVKKTTNMLYREYFYNAVVLNFLAVTLWYIVKNIFGGYIGLVISFVFSILFFYWRKND